MPLLSRLQEALEPHLGARTQAVLAEGLARLGLEPGSLDPDRAAILLKRFVYRELQGQMDAASARKVVEETLRALAQEAPAAREPDPARSDPKRALQQAVSRFKLYFEWPEVQRLRSLAALVEASESEGESSEELLKEALAQIDLLEEKLQNALLRQARDISDLEDALERVKNIGGPKPRRLRSLLKQIKEAQQQETLATAEVERARKLAADLRKLVESSVVQNPTLVPEMAPEAAADAGVIALEDEEVPELIAGEGEEFEILIDFENLEPEVADRIREIDLAEERRRLERLKEQYAAVLGAETVAPLLEAVEATLAAGELAGERLDGLQRALEEAFKDAVAEARARYEWLSERLRSLELEDAELGSQRARTQLELIKESLEMGVLPGDLEQAERQVKALEEALAAKKQESARQNRLLEEARSLIEHAREALPEDDLPELAGFRERLALLETGLEAGEVDEALLGRLKAELPELLSQLAQAGEAARALRARLLAELDALPDLEPLRRTRDSLRLRLEEGAAAGEEEEVAALAAEARRLTQARLDELAARLEAFGLATGEVDEARAELEAGRFPDLTALEARVEQQIAEARGNLLQELRSLRASAERLKELGGDELLEAVARAEAALEEGLPDLAPLKERLHALLERREAWRQELDRRYRTLRERFEAARAVGGETAYRALTLLDFLEKGARRIERLGTSGLAEMERSLGEAEQLVTQLEQEYAAAKEVAEQLSGADLDDLLGVFEAPAEPETPEAEPEPAPPAEGAAAADALAPFRMRGVTWVGWLEENPPAELDAERVRDLLTELGHLRQEVGAQQLRLAVLTLPGHAFLLAPYQGRHLVILAEKAQLSRLVTLIHRSLSATP
ncbi:hypothetical protein [Oceanithermus desulfurans]